MKTKIIPLLLSLIVVLAMACTRQVYVTKEVVVTATPALTLPTLASPRLDFNEIHFRQVSVQTAKPSQIQIVFSLRDENNHALADIPEEKFKGAFRITENNQELAYDETEYFVNTSASFDLEVVFILDFTASMAKAKVDGFENGIDAMVETLIASLDEIPEAHRIGVVEFHDKNAKPSALSIITNNRTSIKTKVKGFSELTKSQYIPGFSRVWDSIPIAVGLFSEKPHTTRAVVVITDGHDTSSDIDREDVFDILSAEDKKIQTYVMGVGNVYEEDVLERLVLATGGDYYPTAELNRLPEQLKIIVDDLQGQYKLSFITGRRTGKIIFGLKLTLGNAEGKSATASWDSQKIDVGPINALDTIGRVTTDPPSVNEAQNKTTLLIRALHIPREIQVIRFRPETDKHFDIEIITKEQGGLIEGWEQSGPDEEGFYEVSGEQALAFGSFGLLFQLKVSDVAAKNFEVPIEFDNKIYTPQGIGECGEMRCLVYDLRGDLGLTPTPAPPDQTATPAAIGWYIESINNSPTDEVKLREAISLLIDETSINSELFYLPNWPSLAETSQSFDPAKAGQLLAEIGDFLPWGKREFGILCIVSSSKGDLQGGLLEIGSDLAAGLGTEANLDAVPNGASCSAGRIIITALRN